MSEAGNNEQIDADILQCKGDILRARSIIPGSPPPYEKKTHQEPNSQKIGENATPSADVEEILADKEKKTREDISSIPVETIHSKNTAPLPAAVDKVNEGETVETPQAQTEIPKFDLAEEIMAEQRKITAIKRKAPGRKTESQREEPEAEWGPVLQKKREMGAQSIGYTIGQPTPALSEQGQIIAEIVARDIEKLCRGGTLGIRGQDFRDTNRDAKQNTQRQL